MADSVKVTKLFDGKEKAVYEFTNKSDGTGESAVQKIDISSLVPDQNGTAPTSLSLLQANYEVNGIDYVEMLWDRTTDVQALLMCDSGFVDFTQVGGNHDTGSGGTGDILITTQNAVSGGAYRITAVYRKRYD